MAKKNIARMRQSLDQVALMAIVCVAMDER